MGLKGWILKRLAYMAVLIYFVASLNFIIFELIPGESAAVEALVGRGRINDPAVVEELRQLYGFGETLEVRYVKYIQNMLTFNFGLSFRSGNPVAEDLMVRLPNTLWLLLTSTALAIVIGIVMGVYAAHKRGGTYDTFSVVSSLTTFSLPTFWMGMVFIMIFYYQFGLLPQGLSQPAEWAIQPPASIFEYIVGKMRHAFLPVLTLTLFQYGLYVLLTRATMAEALTEDYVLTARAKGLKERTVLFKHALRNASLPLVTNVALAFGGIIGGAIITEGIFSWPGIGFWTFQSIDWRDVPVLQAIFYVTALSVILANFLADLFYGVVDPRIKYS